MQFFINAAGCKGIITRAMSENMEHAAIIRKMTEEFDEVELLTFFYCYYFEISVLKLLFFLGKWRISSYYEWYSMEKISIKFL